MERRMREIDEVWGRMNCGWKRLMFGRQLINDGRGGTEGGRGKGREIEVNMAPKGEIAK